MEEAIRYGCGLKTLPEDQWVAAAATAVEISPVNAVPVEQMVDAMEAISKETGTNVSLKPQHLAVLTSKYWGVGGVKLEVAFMEQTSPTLGDKIVSYLNNWRTKGKANVTFVRTNNLNNAPVRCTLQGDSYAAYLGTDILQIPKNQPTLWLGGFTLSTRESEYARVVEHEGGHLLGFPHEQFLPEILALLDYEAVIAEGMRQTGWSRQQVISQMLRPLAPGSYRVGKVDVNGVMMYPFSARVTKNGKAIPGGRGIDEYDAQFASEIYPIKVTTPTPPITKPDPPVTPGGSSMTKENLKAFLSALSGWLIALSWMPGVGSYLKAGGGLLATLASNDVLLSIIVSLMSSGQLNVPAETLEAMKALPTSGQRQLFEAHVQAAMPKEPKTSC